MKPQVTDFDTDVMTPGEVALFCGVDPKTVTRWAESGRLAYYRTLGGHRRFRRPYVEEFERRRRIAQRGGFR